MPVIGGDNWWIAWMPGWLRRWLRWAVLAPPQPGPLAILLVREVSMLRYTIDMPPAPAISDLGKREITVDLNGVDTVTAYAPDTVNFTVDTNAGDVVSITLVDIDKSDNRSQPSPALTFTATDTVPPPVPGGLSVESVEQIDTPTKKKK
jgi:hypothetical protein